MKTLDRTGPLVCLAHRQDQSGPVPPSSYRWLAGKVDVPVPAAESRIQAVDLRDAQLQSNRLRVGRSASAGPLFLDIDVVVSTSAAAARRIFSELAIPRRQRTLYVGTVCGLFGLIKDIHALEIADGVVLFPLSPQSCSELEVSASLIA
ncbi:hypothetical protein [Williamsia soli]|uniref:hypothetical protein n=1 Tax=Williamsia soli TaxID=364929 RepID=UPI001A9D41B5|nr:hypothetical protein [Williamsia soli]